jgi:YcxB-like protein
MTETPIELDVTAITADDYVDAFVARDRVARTARWLSRPVLVGVGVVGALLALVGRYWWVAIALAVFAVLVGFPRLLYRRISRRLVRDNPGLHGPAALTVTRDGVHTRAATTESRVGWSRYQRYVETAESFVLLASDRPGAALQILPKRALAAPAEIGRLRALLDHHLQRVAR